MKDDEDSEQWKAYNHFNIHQQYCLTMQPDLYDEDDILDETIEGEIQALFSDNYIRTNLMKTFAQSRVRSSPRKQYAPLQEDTLVLQSESHGIITQREPQSLEQSSQRNLLDDRSELQPFDALQIQQQSSSVQQLSIPNFEHLRQDQSDSDDEEYNALM